MIVDAHVFAQRALSALEWTEKMTPTRTEMFCALIRAQVLAARCVPRAADNRSSGLTMQRNRVVVPLSVCKLSWGGAYACCSALCVALTLMARCAHAGSAARGRRPGAYLHLCNRMSGRGRAAACYYSYKPRACTQVLCAQGSHCTLTTGSRGLRACLRPVLGAPEAQRPISSPFRPSASFLLRVGAPPLLLCSPACLTSS